MFASAPANKTPRHQPRTEASISANNRGQHSSVIDAKKSRRWCLLTSESQHGDASVKTNSERGRGRGRSRGRVAGNEVHTVRRLPLSCTTGGGRGGSSASVTTWRQRPATAPTTPVLSPAIIPTASGIAAAAAENSSGLRNRRRSSCTAVEVSSEGVPPLHSVTPIRGGAGEVIMSANSQPLHPGSFSSIPSAAAMDEEREGYIAAGDEVLHKPWLTEKPTAGILKKRVSCNNQKQEQQQSLQQGLARRVHFDEEFLRRGYRNGIFVDNAIGLVNLEGVLYGISGPPPPQPRVAALQLHPVFATKVVLAPLSVKDLNSERASTSQSTTVTSISVPASAAADLVSGSTPLGLRLGGPSGGVTRNQSSPVAPSSTTSTSSGAPSPPPSTPAPELVLASPITLDRESTPTENGSMTPLSLTERRLLEAVVTHSGASPRPLGTDGRSFASSAVVLKNKEIGAAIHENATGKLLSPIAIPPRLRPRSSSQSSPAAPPPPPALADTRTAMKVNSTQPSPTSNSSSSSSYTTARNKADDGTATTRKSSQTAKQQRQRNQQQLVLVPFGSRKEILSSDAEENEDERAATTNDSSPHLGEWSFQDYDDHEDEEAMEVDEEAGLSARNSGVLHNRSKIVHGVRLQSPPRSIRMPFRVVRRSSSPTAVNEKDVLWEQRMSTLRTMVIRTRAPGSGGSSHAGKKTSTAPSSP